MAKSGKGNPERRANRIDARADRKMSKAQSTWRRAEATKAASQKSMGSGKNFSGFDFDLNASAKANQLYRKSARQADRAKDLKTRAGIVRAGGASVSGNKKKK